METSFVVRNARTLLGEEVYLIMAFDVSCILSDSLNVASYLLEKLFSWIPTNL